MREGGRPSSTDELILGSEGGLECPAGDFVIDPWQETRTALITHAHADHARPVAQIYYASESSVPLLKHRLGEELDIRGVRFGEPISLGATRVSFHPAGHVLGSAQIRVQRDDDVWVFSGDFKRDNDPSCEAFELVTCNTFITEATFALPIYRWQPGDVVAADIARWWQDMQSAGRPAVLFAYSLGKAQRVLSELCAYTDKAVYLHGAVIALTEIYRNAGVRLLPTLPVDLADRKRNYAGELIIAPPGASGSAWMRRFPNASTGFCSGWMRVRGNRRRRGYERGFVLSDHADWPGLLDTIRQTGANRILTTHGQSTTLVRLLREQGLDAAELRTPYTDEVEPDAGI
ncbi:MAG: ligase-associated DNA damage response exonuclease [Granulosicoccus sp.]|nr:ligase-associated DNA damage response exonuclease [Granulosicoccus sp.]